MHTVPPLHAHPPLQGAAQPPPRLNTRCTLTAAGPRIVHIATTPALPSPEQVPSERAQEDALDARVDETPACGLEAASRQGPHRRAAASPARGNGGAARAKGPQGPKLGLRRQRQPRPERARSDKVGLCSDGAVLHSVVSAQGAGQGWQRTSQQLARGESAEQGVRVS